MRANRGRSGSLRRRIVGVCLAFALLAAFAPTAGAGLRERLQQAKHRLAQIKQEIQHQEQVLADLDARAAVIAQRYLDVNAEYGQITAELAQTRQVLSRTRDRYIELREKLSSRIREAFIQGPGSPLEFLLGATSLTELSDRVEYVDALSNHDADLTAQVQNAKNELVARAADQAMLQAKQLAKLQQVQQAKAAVNAALDKAKEIYQRIQDRRNEAARLVQTLGKKYRAYLRSLYRTKYDPNGVLKVCPVAQPHIVTDSFGAPRYGGGYHPHAGNDILAPSGTPILAPFDGTARASYNGLGGQAVYVYGAAGFVYNAHLSSYSANSNGSVQAGEVIGYVGATGDTSTPHDHFEWHPNALPSAASWPHSPYGYSVIGDAANPYPLLQPVC